LNNLSQGLLKITATCFGKLFVPLIVASSALAIEPQAGPTVAKMHPATANAEERDLGRAGVNLTAQPNIGYSMRFDDNTYWGYYAALLVSIDKKPLRGLTATQVNELLLGPVGSQVELDVMAEDGSLKTISLARQAINKRDEHAPTNGANQSKIGTTTPWYD
jgi:hypothetical protein